MYKDCWPLFMIIAYLQLFLSREKMTNLKSNKKLNLAGLGIVPEKLIEDNFISWRNCLKNYLVGNELWGVVSDEESESVKKNKQEHEEWKKKNALALHAIQLSCGQAIFSKFKEADITARHVWTHLVQEPLPSSYHDKEILVQDNGSRDHFEAHHLYKAIEEGNWHAIKDKLRENPGATREIISSRGDRALHIATLSRHTEIAEKLVKWMTLQDLELKNEFGATALSLGAICGAEKLAKEMVRKNKNLVTIETPGQEDGQLPVIMAALYGHEKMVRYLYNETPENVLSAEEGKNGVTLLNYLVTAEIYDVALSLLKKYPKLCVLPDGSGNYTLKILAQRPSSFPSGTKLAFWERWIYSCVRVHPPRLSRHGSCDKEHAEMQTSIIIDDDMQIESSYVDMTDRRAHGGLEWVRKLGWGILQSIVPKINYIYQRKLVNVGVQKFLSVVFKEMPHLSEQQLEKMDLDKIIYDAIENGIIEFIEEMIKCAPEIIWRKDKKGRTIFSHAILLRQEQIFGLIFTLGKDKCLMGMRHDIFENNYLHLAAKLSPPSQLEIVTGAALQMQRELQWFKEVEDIVQPKLIEELNSYNKTPKILFSDEHEKLAKKAEDWMKSTTGSSMIVGTLIAAVMFTTAFTVPGGNKNDTGMPTMLETQRTPFLIFILSNAVSMFSSSMSLLIFLGILTARYSEKDFLTSLQTKLILGLTCLFISIATMMTSFGAALYLILHENFSWVTVPTIVLTTIPIVLFSLLQFPLLIEMTKRTYGAGIFGKYKKKSRFAKFRACLVWSK